MAVTPFDSALYRDLLTDAEIAPLFTDSAEIRAMLLVLGTLAREQGQLGVIPETSGAFLHRAAMEVQVDPAGLAADTARDGSPVPALIAAFAKVLEAPEHASCLQHGATDEDIARTALALRLRQALAILETRLTGAFRNRLQVLRPRVQAVSLSDDRTRAALARALHLSPAGGGAEDRQRLARLLAEIVASRPGPLGAFAAGLTGPSGGPLQDALCLGPLTMCAARAAQ
ncbi:hypothetical protein C8N32_11071 [Rhodovulum imhoffii]|uniref:Uncharacterized protein n=1 Tax=Rhodovulum imhoffii TaxID=365340 RepID=A0A2T5BRA2_9RHOB|nr:hypothetical protein [Rhodovulum imhoffii]MBK5934443.1 hypothetical protein [Rhodovulum imhoffii]PTN01790.1 hypothetical protein C8N32_11071 [Rhodovulum imhoffii]